MLSLLFCTVNKNRDFIGFNFSEATYTRDRQNLYNTLIESLTR